MPIVGWRVWYDDDSVVEGHTFADWEALPDDGVLFVKLYEDRDNRQGMPYGENQSGLDHYFSTAEGIHAMSNDTTAEILARYPGASIKRGKWTTVDKMHEIIALTLDATDRP
jgi:hypothetical protein